MKKSISLVLLGLSVIISSPVLAQSRTVKGVSPTQQLGISAGVALACQVDRDDLKNYEMIASRLIANPLPSDDAEKVALEEYAKAKLTAYEDQKKKNTMNCTEVLSRFHNQKIFDAIVYQDGTLEMPDGKIIKPKRPVMKMPSAPKKQAKKKKATLKPFSPKK